MIKSVTIHTSNGLQIRVSFAFASTLFVDGRNAKNVPGILTMEQNDYMKFCFKNGVLLDPDVWYPAVAKNMN